MATQSDLDTPSLPSEPDETLMGRARLIKLASDQVRMVRVLQHKARKWIRKRQTWKDEHKDVEHDLHILQYQLARRIATDDEWDKLQRLDSEQDELLKNIHIATTVIADTLEQIEERMQMASHYINLLEESNDDTWMDCDI